MAKLSVNFLFKASFVNAILSERNPLKPYVELSFFSKSARHPTWVEERRLLFAVMKKLHKDLSKQKFFHRPQPLIAANQHLSLPLSSLGCCYRVLKQNISFQRCFCFPFFLV